MFSQPRLASEDVSLSFEKPETAVTYKAYLEGDVSDDISDLIKDSLVLFKEEGNGAPSAGHLRQRALSGIETIQKIMRSRGYYDSSVDFEIANDPEAKQDEGGTAKTQDEDTQSPPMRVTLTVTPNKVFTLNQFGIQYQTPGTQPQPDIPNDVKRIPLNQPAVAADIVAVEARINKWLLENGYPYAEFRSRDVLADMERQTLSISSIFDTGPKVMYGDVVLKGNNNVSSEYLETYIPWDRDTTVSETGIGSYQRALSSTQLFDRVSVSVPQPAPEPENADPVTVPILVDMEEAKFRSIGIGGRYSTDLGPIVRFSFEHRNLFGANETLNTDLDAGLEYQQLSNAFRKPQFMRAGQDIVGAFTLRRELSDEYDEQAATVTAGLERELSPKLKVGLGGLAEFAVIDDGEESINSYLLGAPAFLEYNGSDDLLNPTEGVRGRLSATPFVGSYDQIVQFTVIDAQASTYFSLDSKKRYILAFRGRVASIVGTDREDVPRNRRLYAGGGGSVRGYSLRSIGDLDDSDDALGGISAIEFGAEMRMQVTDSIGIVPFFDAGTVGSDLFTGFDEEFQYATGLGFRYFTAIGPIRADIGVPLNKRDSDSGYQLYISIGQAF